jgi:hypothetical protein
MGHHQAADLVWKLGAIGRTADGKPTNWAAVHPEFYNLQGRPAGLRHRRQRGRGVAAVRPLPQERPCGQPQGRSVAQYIASRPVARHPRRLIDNLCYMLVNPTRWRRSRCSSTTRWAPKATWSRRRSTTTTAAARCGTKTCAGTADAPPPGSSNSASGLRPTSALLSTMLRRIGRLTRPTVQRERTGAGGRPGDDPVSSAVKGAFDAANTATAQLEQDGLAKARLAARHGPSPALRG